MRHHHLTLVLLRIIKFQNYTENNSPKSWIKHKLLLFLYCDNNLIVNHLIVNSMKTLNELREVAEKKGLRFEINEWDPSLDKWDLKDGKTPDPNFLKVEIGMNYRANTWAWWESTVVTKEQIENGEITLLFRNTYNQNMGAEDKSWNRGFRVENQLFGE